MKSLLVIFVVLIVGVIFIVTWNYNSKPLSDHIDYNEISWRLPVDTEDQRVRESFIISEISQCKSYYIKKVEDDKFLIACNSGDGTWTYFTASLNKKNIFRTPEELSISLIPPDILQEEAIEYPRKPNLKIRKSTTLSGKTLEAK